MNQNNIQSILKRNSIIPVVTFNKIDEIDKVIEDLINQKIHCIEVTLRTSIAFNAIKYIKDKYATEICVGAGTVINHEQIKKLDELNIDFIVSPAISKNLIKELIKTTIPFINGVSTPSEILLGMELGCKIFKFFPANLSGGVPALKTYKNIFPDVTFCPTGGIKESTYKEYLQLENVVSVGGSWMVTLS